MSRKRVGQLRRESPAGVEVPAGQVRILESHHAADFSMEPDVWPFHKLCWVAVGKGHLDCDGQMIPLEGGDFSLLPLGQTHRFVDDPKDPLTLIILCISRQCVAEGHGGRLSDLWGQLIAAWPATMTRRPRSAFHFNSLQEDLRQALREQENQRPGWEIALEAATARILVRLSRGFSVPSSEMTGGSEVTVRGAVEYIDAHPYEALQIEQMAERCDLSPRRFTDLFKGLTGQTFSHYLNQSRIDYACRRLDETGHIVYACHESGFNDLAYFYRVFKKFRGQTPGDYLSNRA